MLWTKITREMEDWTLKQFVDEVLKESGDRFYGYIEIENYGGIMYANGKLIIGYSARVNKLLDYKVIEIFTSKDALDLERQDFDVHIAVPDSYNDINEW